MKITSIHDLLKFSKEYRLILQTITQIVPLLSDMFIQLFLLILFYSSVGNYLFGGEVDNTTKEKFNFEVGDNMEEGYEYLTFNDTPSSMLFLYAILINNDWSKLMMQAMAKREQPIDILWGRVFFISYYFLTFMVVLSTIVGAVVDFINTYLQMLGEEEELEKKSEKKPKATQGLFGIMRKKKHKKKTHSDSEDDGTDNKKLAEIDENYVDLGLAE